MWIMDRRDGGTFLVEPVVATEKKMEEVFVFPEPTLFMRHDQAVSFLRSMADELKRHGYEIFSPDELKHELKATKYHLEDMRKMAIEGANNE